ncbi:Predicted small secreted protein [Ligilactobacillus sp. WC1T17]|uniref:Predicted small secreted protein n=1 Tax=Ligilactobacillus ruminis TaxID=1623 RepID=A0ABY1A9Q7_9LACO|nr:Predicted small secreted protein [Ligilactobacillus ruminis]
MKKTTLLSLLLGASAGVLGAKAYLARPLSAHRVLTKVKQQFQTESPVYGTWIEHKRRPLQRFALKYQTYHGGLSRYEDERLVSYEFTAEAKTGTVIEIKRLD